MSAVEEAAPRLDYHATLDFDLAVLLFIVVVIPLGVSLLACGKGRTSSHKLGALCLFVSFFYIGIFEHYRMHVPHITQKGLKHSLTHTFVPSVMLEYVEVNSWSVAYLPLDNATDATGAMPRAMRITHTQTKQVGAPQGTFELPSTTAVHLAHEFAGDTFFRDVFQRFAAASCEKTGGAACLRVSKLGEPVAQDAQLVQLADPEPPAVRALGRPYRAVFTVRDPRDMVMDSVAAGTHATLEEAIDNFAARSRLATDAKAFSLSNDNNVTFLRFEDLVRAPPSVFSAIGQWYQLEGALLDLFVAACGRTAQEQTTPIGGWRSQFTREHENRFLARHSQLLQQLGYRSVPMIH